MESLKKTNFIEKGEIQVNLLEHHIKEIFSETELENDYVEVHFMVNCWGSKEEKKMKLPMTLWQLWKKRGYYMG